MYRESGSLLVWLLNRGTSGSAIEGRSCESARSRLPYLGPWVSKFCVPGGHPKIARPTEASIVGWLRCDGFVGLLELEGIAAEEGPNRFKIAFLTAVKEMTVHGCEEERLRTRYLEITESAEELGTIRPASSMAEFLQRYYEPCDWVDQMNRIGERLPFLLEDDEVRSAVKGASRC